MNKVKKFFEQSKKISFLEDLEESQPFYDLAYEIYTHQSQIQHLRLYILSSRIVNDRVKHKETNRSDELSISYQLWDMSRLHRLTTSTDKKEDIEIDFEALYDQPVYGLPAHLDTKDYQSYLVVLPGELLANIYDEYGSRLLEQNVRTFLQARGNVRATFPQGCYQKVSAHMFSCV